MPGFDFAWHRLLRRTLVPEVVLMINLRQYENPINKTLLKTFFISQPSLLFLNKIHEFVDSISVVEVSDTTKMPWSCSAHKKELHFLNLSQEGFDKI